MCPQVRTKISHFFLCNTYVEQEHVHLQLSDSAPDAASHPEAEGDGAEGVGPLAAVAEPPLRLKAAGLREGVLVVTHGVVTEVESGLPKTTTSN